MRDAYELVKDWLIPDFDALLNMFYDSHMPISISDYIEELKKEMTGPEITDVHYMFRGEEQDPDLVLFSMSYVRYAAIKLMLQGKWNWRVNVFHMYTAYDQPICIKAREMGIDIVILVTESSTGMYKIRTEIVDTRSRDHSTENLRIKGDAFTLRRRKYEKDELDNYLGM